MVIFWAAAGIDTAITASNRGAVLFIWTSDFQKVQS